MCVCDSGVCVFVGQQPTPGIVPQDINYLGFVRQGLIVQGSLTWNTLISQQVSEICLHSPRGGISSAWHCVQVVCLFVCKSSRLHSKHLTNRTISSAQERVLKGKRKLLEFKATKLDPSCGLHRPGYRKQSSYLSSRCRLSANHPACLSAPSLFRAHNRASSLLSYSLLFCCQRWNCNAPPALPHLEINTLRRSENFQQLAGTITSN